MVDEKTADMMESAERIKDWLISIRRDIHKNPEVGFDVERTAGLVEAHLGEWGVGSRRVLETGVVAEIRGGLGEGPCIALRADMDALPMQDAKMGELHSQTDGVMHACGHDAHVACLLGTARLVAARRSRFRGTVKFLFQPGEETDTGGAQPMIEAGVLEEPLVDVLYGLHVDPACNAGKINLTAGSAYAAADLFDVTLTGSGAHGAYPHEGTDVICAVGQCISALQSIVSRNVSPLESAVVTVGTIHAGTARNVLPVHAAFSGIIRTLDPDVRETVLRRFRTVTEGVCRSLGVDVAVTLRPGYPLLRNDALLLERLRDIAIRLIGPENVLAGRAVMGVDDFAYFAQERPACYFNLGVRNPEKGAAYPLHSDRFDLDEDALPIGAALLAAAALDHLREE